METGEWILIRPDGYVAAFVGAARINMLVKHFDTIDDALLAHAETSVGTKIRT